MSKRTNPTRVVKSAFVDCRTFQHSWTPYDVWLEANAFVQLVQCTRCATIKKFRINKRTGEVVAGTSYAYPEGYVIPGGRLTADERGSLRLMSVQRTTPRGGHQ